MPTLTLNDNNRIKLIDLTETYAYGMSKYLVRAK